MSLPPNKLSRVIINTDAKNEADDQYAIVQGLLTPSFELHGIIAAHFGSIKSKTSMQDSYDEVMKLLDLMALRGQVRVEKGAEGPITNEQTAADSPGARFIVEQGMKDDPRPLHVAFLGPLTDMASALLIEPQLAKRNIRVVWIGGGEWPVGGREYNLLNDIAAANVVYRSGIEIWQIPSPVYKMMAVSYAELHERVFDKGPLGKYLVEQLVDWNSRMVPGPIEHRSLGEFTGDRRHDVSGLWRVIVGGGTAIHAYDELLARRQTRFGPALPKRRSALHPGRLLRQAEPVCARRSRIREIWRLTERRCLIRIPSKGGSSTRKCWIA